MIRVDCPRPLLARPERGIGLMSTDLCLVNLSRKQSGVNAEWP